MTVCEKVSYAGVCEKNIIMVDFYKLFHNKTGT